MKFTIAAVILALAVASQASVIGYPLVAAHSVYAYEHDDGQWDHDIYGDDGSYRQNIHEDDGSYRPKSYDYGVWEHGAEIVSAHYAPAAHVIATTNSAHAYAAHQPAHIVSQPGILVADSHAAQVVPYVSHAHEGYTIHTNIFMFYVLSLIMFYSAEVTLLLIGDLYMLRH